VELVFLEVLEQRAAGAMDNTLGYTGGARGIHDVERVVEGQGGEADVVDTGLPEELYLMGKRI